VRIRTVHSFLKLFLIVLPTGGPLINAFGAKRHRNFSLDPLSDPINNLAKRFRDGRDKQSCKFSRQGGGKGRGQPSLRRERGGGLDKGSQEKAAMRI